MKQPDPNESAAELPIFDVQDSFGQIFSISVIPEYTVETRWGLIEATALMWSWSEEGHPFVRQFFVPVFNDWWKE